MQSCYLVTVVRGRPPIVQTELTTLLFTNRDIPESKKDYMHRPKKMVGNNFEVGQKLGRYWGDYFGELDKRSKIYRDYKSWLQENHLTEKYARLLINIVHEFPLLFDELTGMTVGINESNIGYKASLLGVFTCWLAETDGEFGDYSGCTSVLSPTENGYFLAHSDEYDDQYPLVVTDVSLKSGDDFIDFISISHPFQLFGSAAGMTKNFAFQGNSIGCNKIIFQELQKTWATRIPKTVLSRMLLEKTTIDEIQALYSQYRSTLPNHHYVVFTNCAYSIEIRPTYTNQVIVKQLIDGCIHVHTNHFLEDATGDWIFGDDNMESNVRFKEISSKMNLNATPKEIKTEFSNFLCKYRQNGELLINLTSGAFYFTVSKENLSCNAELSYPKASSISIVLIAKG